MKVFHNMKEDEENEEIPCDIEDLENDSTGDSADFIDQFNLINNECGIDFPKIHVLSQLII